MQEYILFGLGTSMAIMGWFCRQLWDAVQSLKSDLKTLELKVSAEYVRYDRLQDMIAPIMHALEEIKETLKSKVDK
jgi:septation ring formation regulator EzrA